MDNCDQLALDNNWSLTRENACHIGVTNTEMGNVQKDILNIKNDINTIKGFQGINLAIWGAIAFILIGLVIKKMWGK